MPLLLSILYAVLCLLSDLALLRFRPAAARDVELLASRHEVRVLRRAAKPNRWWPGDRLALSALSRPPTRPDWGCLPVRSETILRWHRDSQRQTSVRRATTICRPHPGSSTDVQPDRRGQPT